MAAFVINSFLFRQPNPPTYDETLEGLITVKNLNQRGSVAFNVKIPILFKEYPVQTENTPTILFCHGNAEDLGHYSRAIQRMSMEWRSNICVFDYRGYGLNIGTTNQENCFDDTHSVYEWLTEQKDVKNKNLIIVGRSMGSGPACQLAEFLSVKKIEIKGLILLSPLESAARVALSFSLPGDVFTNYRRAPNINCPVLIFHGSADTVIPVKAAENLFPLFPNPAKELIIIPDGGHNNIHGKLRVREKISQFFKLTKLSFQDLTNYNLIDFEANQTTFFIVISDGKKEYCLIYLPDLTLGSKIYLLNFETNFLSLSGPIDISTYVQHKKLPSFEVYKPYADSIVLKEYIDKMVYYQLSSYYYDLLKTEDGFYIETSNQLPEFFSWFMDNSLQHMDQFDDGEFFYGLQMYDPEQTMIDSNVV